MNPFTPCDPATVARAADVLCAADVRLRHDSLLASDLRELRVLVDRLEGEFLRRLGEFDARGGAAVDGALSTQAWLRHMTRLSPSAAKGRLLVARRLRADEETPLAVAVRAGELSYAHASVVTAALDAVPVAAHAAVETLLVEHGRHMDPGDLRRASDRVKETLAPEVFAEEADLRHERRFLHVSETFHGSVRVDGLLDTEGGAVVLSALRTLSMPSGPDDRRTSPQRHADALVDIARLVLDAGSLSDDGGEPPHVSILVDLADVCSAAGLGHLEDGSVLTGEAIRRILCDAQVTRVVTDGIGQVLDVGRATRTIPSAVRRALVARDRGCIFPGCHRPPRWCDAHHVVFWARGGMTALSNLVLLCRRHHRLVHEGGWEVVAVGPSFAVVPPAFAGRSPPAGDEWGPSPDPTLSGVWQLLPRADSGYAGET